MALNFKQRSKKFKFFFVLGVLIVLGALTNNGNQSSTTSTPAPVQEKKLKPQEEIINTILKNNSFLGNSSETKIEGEKYIVTTNISSYVFEFENDKLKSLTFNIPNGPNLAIEVKNNVIDKANFEDVLKNQLPQLLETAKLKTKIESQFSLWDGSHKNLVKVVKENLNDPKSFKHQETKYKYDDKDKILTVYMTFRAKNALGALVLNTATATADLDGNILSLDIQ